MRERIEFGKAFANWIRQLILEIAYDLPHPMGQDISHRDDDDPPNPRRDIPGSEDEEDHPSDDILPYV